MFSLTDKIALVTGAGSGIGAGIAAMVTGGALPGERRLGRGLRTQHRHT